jgi:hypothetical protein
MKRVISVIVLAFLMTEATGINDASLARAQNRATAQERRAALEIRIAQIPLHSHVKIELENDTKVDAHLVEVTPDAITVDRIAHRDKNERRTIAIADIAKIEKAKSTARRVLVIAGVTLVALFVVAAGSCAAAYASPTIPAEHRP